MSREKKTQEARQKGRDDIGKLFTTVKREGKVFLKEGKALGGGKRASKIPIDGTWCAFWCTNNNKQDPRF